jgi:Transposase DDE domain
MDIKFTEKKLIEIFIDIDDLLKMYQAYQHSLLLGTIKLPTRKPELSASEVCTIVACYHLSGYKCFERAANRYYYRRVIKETHLSYFPSAPSYERFLVLMSRSYNLMWLWSVHCCLHSQRNGLYFIDSKKLAVCHLKRQHSHKVFAGSARKGKTSTGLGSPDDFTALSCI